MNSRSSLIISAVLLLGAVPVSGQQAVAHYTKPSIPNHMNTPDGFVPPGWKIVAEAQGELDEGKRSAVALVLNRAGKPDISQDGDDDDVARRLLLVAVKADGGGYDLVASNDTLIFLRDDEWRLVSLSGPFNQSGLVFARGALRLSLQTEWYKGNDAGQSQTFAFRLKEGHLILIGYDRWAVSQSLETVSKSYNFLTGKARLSQGIDCAGRKDVIAYCHYMSSWKRLKIVQPPLIEQIGDAWAFDPATE